MYEKIFENLNPEQREAVEYLQGPLLILAGAGSGKTRVLTCRVANLLANNVNPWNILAITFTNKAANEMKTRVEKLVGADAKDMWLSTFHSFCARVLRREIEITGRYSSNFVIYDSTDTKSLIKKCIDELFKGEGEYIDSSGIQSMISNAKNNFITAEKFKDWRISVHEANNDEKFLREFEKITESVYHLYTKKLIENNAMDFDDLLLVTVALFHEFPTVLEKYQNRFKYISIDEYQDTNGVQYRLAKMLADKHHNICVVGDADQSIYKFRGADFRNILKFEKDYPEAKVIKLEQNYRSTKKILKAANSVISYNEIRKEKNLWTENFSGNALKLFQASNPFQEADMVARTIYHLHMDLDEPFKNFAILYRANWQSRVLEEKLVQLRIPYVIIGGLRFFERKEIKDILAYLKVVLNPRDELSLIRALQVPKRGIGSNTIEKISNTATEFSVSMFDVISTPQLLDQVPKLRPITRLAIENFSSLIMQWQSVVNEISVDTLTEKILNESGLRREIEDSMNEIERESRLNNLDEFLRITEEFTYNTEIEHSLTDFLMQASLMTDVENDSDAKNYVSLMTVHAAKGLEFPTVFVVGLEEGIFPHNRSLTSQEDLEEERRACYVALTRAQKNLCLSYSMTRMMNGKNTVQSPSRFLNEIPRDCFETAEKKSVQDKPRLTSSRKSIPPVKKSVPISIPPKTKPNVSLVLNVGDKVEHAMFGRGEIVKLIGSGENTIIDIKFDNGDKKTFAKKFAPLKKI